MAAVFLVTLYEYSPLFYITVISLCFVVTAAIVLCRIGVDIPVILRTSDGTESDLPTPERHMVQVTNPFRLEIGFGSASVSAGVSLRTYCLKPSTLSCFWGCKVDALQQCLQVHRQGTRLNAPQSLLDTLSFHCQYSQTYEISSHSVQEWHTQIPAELGIADFGPLPRECYPLVAVLTLEEQEAREQNISASVAVIHVPDDKYRLSARMVFQYLLTLQGEMYELKPLFMSADGAEAPGASHPKETDTRSRETSVGERELLGEEGWSDARDRDCVVCQNAAVNRVLLPCRHTCVCDGCMPYLQHCPVCRAFIVESFTLTRGPAAT